MVNMMKTKLLSTIALVVSMIVAPVVNAEQINREFVLQGAIYGCHREAIIHSAAVRFVHTSVTMDIDVLDMVADLYSLPIGIWRNEGVTPKQVMLLAKNNFNGEDELKNRGIHWLETMRGVESFRLIQAIAEYGTLDGIAFMDIDKVSDAVQEATYSACVDTLKDALYTIADLELTQD